MTYFIFYYEMCALLIYVFNGFSPENHYFCMRIIQLYIMMTIDNNTGLVLEGGGMRGVFTSGVLDGFMKHGLYFNYVVAVSAGACNGMSYATPCTCLEHRLYGTLRLHRFPSFPYAG